MTKHRRTRRPTLWLMPLLLLLLGCQQGGAVVAASVEEPSVEPEAVDDASLERADADWVASKLQAPPPVEKKDWLREIEKDPIAALRQMDPGALQPSDKSSQRPANVSEESALRPQNAPKYEPSKPLRGWPPVVGQFYPELVLPDQTGQVTAISDFRGKVVLLEVVGLTCRACHAFAGGNEPGLDRFHGIEPQRGLPSIERYAKGYAKLSLDHPDIIFVQLVLYGLDGQSPPSENDVRDWANHFGMDRNANEVVLIGDQRFISSATRALIPGFHLIDQDGILRAMNSNNPSHDRLDSSLLPKLASLVKDGG